MNTKITSAKKRYNCFVIRGVFHGHPFEIWVHGGPWEQDRYGGPLASHRYLIPRRYQISFLEWLRGKHQSRHIHRLLSGPGKDWQSDYIPPVTAGGNVLEPRS